MWSKNGRPVFALDLPTPSSFKSIVTSTSFVLRVTFAARLLTGIQHSPQRLDELRVLVCGPDGNAQRARNLGRKVAHEHARVGERLPDVRAVARRSEQDEVRVGREHVDAGH